MLCCAWRNFKSTAKMLELVLYTDDVARTSGAVCPVTDWRAPHVPCRVGAPCRAGRRGPFRPAPVRPNSELGRATQIECVPGRVGLGEIRVAGLARTRVCVPSARDKSRTTPSAGGRPLHHLLVAD
jgi:hypothetical protein